MNKKQKRYIVIAHDNAEMRNMFARLLGREEFDLFQVSDTHQLVELVEHKSVELIFLNIYLPGMHNAYELVAKIKRIKPSVKIVVLTDNDNKSIRSKMLYAGAAECMKKPFHLGCILRTVERTLDIILADRKISVDQDHDAENLFQSAFSYKVLEKDRRLIFTLGIVGLLFLFVFISGLAGFYHAKQDQVYRTPYANPTAMTWDGESLWVSDWVTQSFYQHDRKNKFAVKKVYYVQSSHPTGFAWDGETLWSCNAWEKKIYKHRLDSVFSVIAEYKTPGNYPTGLFFDGTYLWICDSSKPAQIFKTKLIADTIKVIASYPAPGNEPVGMFSDGKNFWTADSETGCLYKHAFDDNLTVQAVYQPRQYDAGRDRLTGMTWDGKHIWTCSEGSHRIYRHTLSNLIQKSPVF